MPVSSTTPWVRMTPLADWKTVRCIFGVCDCAHRSAACTSMWMRTWLDTRMPLIICAEPKSSLAK
jgi:hypothetical protein